MALDIAIKPERVEANELMSGTEMLQNMITPSESCVQEMQKMNESR